MNYMKNLANSRKSSSSLDKNKKKESQNSNKNTPTKLSSDQIKNS